MSVLFSTHKSKGALHHELLWMNEQRTRIFGYNNPSPTSDDQREYGYEVCVTVDADSISGLKSIRALMKRLIMSEAWISLHADFRTLRTLKQPNDARSVISLCDNARKIDSDRIKKHNQNNSGRGEEAEHPERRNRHHVS